jgi:hypothetical protein
MRRRSVAISEVRLLDIGETEKEVFTRWDITGHQLNRRLLSKPFTGTDGVVLDHLTFPPGLVIAETIRAGRAAGIDDSTLAATLRDLPMTPPGLRNRIDVLFDPDHAGWLSSVQAVKDVTLFLDLANGGASLPVTEAARDAYRQMTPDGWETQDVTALVEYGRRSA